MKRKGKQSAEHKMFMSLVTLISLLALVESTTNSVYHCIDITGRVETCPGGVKPTHLNDTKLAAYTRHARRINETGWDELELVTNALVDDKLQAYLAGYLEGYVTANLIESTLYNFITDHEKWCKAYGDFVGKSLNITMKKIRNKISDPYWHQVSLSLAQLAGLEDGYNAKKNNKSHYQDNEIKPHLDLDPCGLIFLNIYTEVDDIDSILKREEHLEPPMERCSALVKVIPGETDVFVGHNTWSWPKTMLRIVKRYVFNFSTSRAKSVTMSSYPGFIFSADDFYITSQHLVIQETSIDSYNPKVYEKTKIDKIVFEFIRNMVSNRLARDGAEWVKYFSLFNSGTYNNQFMIVDYKQFRPGFIQPGFLYIAEQMPHMIKYIDATEILKKQSYWASYNVPYFTEIYHEAGYDRMYKQYGDHFSHSKNVRAQIFARDHAKVSNMSTMFHLMRYNNFQEDKLSACACSPGNYSASRAIASRGDLNDKNGMYNIEEGFDSMIAIDAKITSSELAINEEMIAISGPTNEQVEIFDWRHTQLTDQRHRDQPSRWIFKPMLVRWSSGTTFQEFPIA